MLLIPKVNLGTGARLVSVSQAWPGWHGVKGYSPRPQEGASRAGFQMGS